MLLRIEQGKGQKDRFALLSPVLLELLRDWYRIARPAVWLFPGRDRLLPLTTRQFNRAVHAAAEMAEIKKRVTPLVERAGLSTLNEGQTVQYEIVSNRGKESAENLKIA